MAAIAGKFTDTRDFFFLGRHVGFPVALEGALKLKEISYVRAEGYPAGELKHGPIALIVPGTVVVGVATRTHLWEKMMGNVAEVQARGATVVLVANEGDEDTAAQADEVLWVPEDPSAVRAGARRRAPAAAGVPHRPAARSQRRPASQPGQDRHGGVTAPRGDLGGGGVCGIGVDAVDVVRFRRVHRSAGPASWTACSPRPSGPTRSGAATPALAWPCVSRPKRRC